MPTFSSITGQDGAVGALRRALASEQLAGSYLFLGQPGVGRTTAARAFAQAAACLSPVKDPFDSCGVCSSCRMAEAENHPEIVIVKPAGEQMLIGQFWDRPNRPPGILSHTLSFAPSIGRKRVYILEQAESFSESAANSLLKVLEEPPSYALFILLAPHLSRILPTIVSRSQSIRIRPISHDLLVSLIQEKYDLPFEESSALASYTEGKTGHAIRFARDPVARAERNRIIDLAEQFPSATKGRALLLAEQLRKSAGQIKALNFEASSPDNEEESESGAKERAGQRQYSVLIDIFISVYRDLCALRSCGEYAPVVNMDRKESFLSLASQMSVGAGMSALDSLFRARRRLTANVSIPLLTDALAISLTSSH